MYPSSVTIQQVPIVSAIAPGVVHYYTTTSTDSPTNLSNLSLTSIISSSGPVAYQQLPHPQSLSIQSTPLPLPLPIPQLPSYQQQQLTVATQQLSSTHQQIYTVNDLTIASSAGLNNATTATTVQLLNNLNQTTHSQQQCSTSLLNAVNQVTAPNNYFNNFTDGGKEIMVRRRKLLST